MVTDTIIEHSNSGNLATNAPICTIYQSQKQMAKLNDPSQKSIRSSMKELEHLPSVLIDVGMPITNTKSNESIVDISTRSKVHQTILSPPVDGSKIIPKRVSKRRKSPKPRVKQKKEIIREIQISPSFPKVAEHLKDCINTSSVMRPLQYIITMS